MKMSWESNIMDRAKTEFFKTVIFVGICFVISVIITIIEEVLGRSSNDHILEYIGPQALVSIVLGPLIYWTYRFLKWSITYMSKN